MAAKVWIVVCRTGCDVTRWLCEACIPLVRARGVEIEQKRPLTTGFPCEECSGSHHATKEGQGQ